ncbi:5' nucleotidase, NT5C type [Desmospora profundinema]|uniref:Nucleotidase n=1 Tax=Desmospora profundinema TaxID=1571184 RepID=A0ABU1IKC2_9BACL|nr:hypothetical protein [Desmospora profundinema]MDR6225208.1 putative HAD superfamily protein [Desmospora profundinema]
MKKDGVRLIIGVDIDGTIKNTQEAAVRVFNEELGRSIKKEDVTDFYLDKAYGLTKREGTRLWRKLEARIYSLGVPLPNAASILNQLSQQGHRIYFITARPGMRKVTQVTKEWLQEHGFPFDGDNLKMGCHDKAAVARDLGVELFFEDAPQHLDKLVKAGVPTVIVDAVYNRNYPHDLPRIESWDEAMAWIKQPPKPQ